MNSVSGICTDRLTPKQLKLWRSMEQTIGVTGKDGFLAHSELNHLWQSVRKSKSVIYIEMQQRKTAYVDGCAGVTEVEVFDSDEKVQTAVIRLYLGTIRNAWANDGAAVDGGFTRFRGLGMTERYIEVLGHELAHLLLILQSPDYAHLYRTQSRLRAEIIHLREQGSVHDESVQQRLLRLKDLDHEIEEPALISEARIWRELLGGQETGK